MIIGANKAGTTSLHHYLSQHPEVFMCQPKEPMFFLHEKESIEKITSSRAGAVFRRQVVCDERRYLSLFKKTEGYRAVGEASTGYLPYEFVAERVQRKIPHVRIIAILRNPVFRAFSNYRMYAQRGIEWLPFHKAVEAELSDRIEVDGWQRHYVKFGFYGRQLEAWSKYFSRDNFCIFIYEDLSTSPSKLTHSLFEFIGVDPYFKVNFEKRLNVDRGKATPVPKHSPFLLYTLFHIGKKIPGNAGRLISGSAEWLGTRQIDKQLSVKDRQWLVELYREDILKLQDMIHRDLSSWLS